VKLLHLNDIPITKAHNDLDRRRFVAPGDLQSDVQTVNYVELDKGQSYVPHSHPDCEECFFIIDGETTAVIAGETLVLTKGDFLVVEVGEEHTFNNTSEKACIFFQFRILV